MRPPFGDLFKSTKIEVVQSVVASEQLDDLVKSIVAEINAVSETQKNCKCKDLLEEFNQLVRGNGRANSEAMMLREAQVCKNFICFFVLKDLSEHCPIGSGLCS